MAYDTAFTGQKFKVIGTRPLRPDGEVADEQHHRLDGDAADEVPRGELEVPLQGRRDRDRELRQAAGDREQDQPADLVAEPEPRVERVRRLREQDAGRPRRAGRAEEDQQKERRAEAGHTGTMRAAADGAARGGLTSSAYRTARYFFISQSVSWTRYSSHSFRFSST